jgi:cyanophycinase
VWQRIVWRRRGRAHRGVCLGRGRPGAGGAAIVEYLNRYGADAFPLAVKLADSDYRQAADDPLLADAVRSAGGVFFSGGDQARITQALVREDGSRSAVLDAVWELYRAAAWWPATAPARPS